jgi:hypothetical protein
LAALAGLGRDLPHARAATYTVTNINAGGPGSLRQAILDANGNIGHDTIDFSTTSTIVLTDALPEIGDDLTITGVTMRDGSAGTGGGIWSAGDLHLNAVHILSNSASIGGGVFIDQGSTTLSGTRVISNSAGSGGGVFAKEESATLNMSGGEIGNNSANYYGGGIYVTSGTATVGTKT